MNEKIPTDQWDNGTKGVKKTTAGQLSKSCE